VLTRRTALFVPSVIALAACAGSADVPAPADGLAIAIAPLSLPGIGFACYDFRVNNGPGGTGDVVWKKGDPNLTRLGQNQNADPGNTATNPLVPGSADGETICSNNFGNGPGSDVTYIGTCDADGPSGVRKNSVTLWVDGLYNAGGTADIGEWRDPCANGCTLEVDCVENADAQIQFNLAIMRAAKQGFFDIAVNFSDIFCSAKADCGAGDGGLLFRPDGTRGPTVVMAFACTAGPGADTQLSMSELGIWCGATPASATRVATLDPAAGPGNVYRPVTSDPVAGDGVWQYAIYEGVERLNVAADMRKLYWNVAIGIDVAELVQTDADPEADRYCWLRATATASEGELSDENATTPYINWDVPLNLVVGNDAGQVTTAPGLGLTCGENPLDTVGDGYCVTVDNEGQPTVVPCVSTVYDPVDQTLCFDNTMTGNFATFEATSSDTPCTTPTGPTEVILPNGAPGGCVNVPADGESHAVTVRYACDDRCSLYFDGQLINANAGSPGWSTILTDTIEGVTTGCHVVGVHTVDTARVVSGFIATISVDGATQGQPGFFVTAATPAMTVAENAPDDAQGDTWSELDYDLVFPEAIQCGQSAMNTWSGGWSSFYTLGARPIWYNTTCTGNYNNGYARIVFTVQ
jgi:hypothetical protein